MKKSAHKKGKKKNGRGKARKSRMRIAKPISNQSRVYTQDLLGEYPIGIYAAAIGTNSVSTTVSQNYPGYCSGNINLNGTSFSHVLMNQAVGVGAGGILSNKYATLMGLFDEYTVNYLECRYIPNEQTVRTQSANMDLGDWPEITYMWKDYDDEVVSTTEAIVLDFGATPKSNNKGSVHTIKFHQVYKGAQKWFNTGLITTIPSATQTAGTGALPGAYKSIKLFFPRIEVVAANTQYYFGRLYCKWNITFRGLTNT